MNRFEKALRLILALEKLIDENKGDSSEADDVRDELDSFFGWCGPHYLPENRLTNEEEKLIEQIVTMCRNK